MDGGNETARFVLCTDNRGWPASLEVRKLYRVLLDPLAQKRGLLRVIDESGGDYLYPSGHFVAVELPAATAKLLAGQL